jgi:hypothetical protein
VENQANRQEHRIMGLERNISSHHNIDSLNNKLSKSAIREPPPPKLCVEPPAATQKHPCDDER